MVRPLMPVLTRPSETDDEVLQVQSRSGAQHRTLLGPQFLKIIDVAAPSIPSDVAEGGYVEFGELLDRNGRYIAHVDMLWFSSIRCPRSWRSRFACG